MQRRDFLKLGLGGLTLPQVLALRAGANEGSHGFGRAKNCIVLFCWGGISHLDTFDLKPNAPSNIRGTFNEIPTTVPGIRVGEHLPGFARTRNTGPSCAALITMRRVIVPGLTGISPGINRKT